MSLVTRATVAATIAWFAAAGAVAQDPADLAWNRGDHDVARELYTARVTADSSDVRALHRLALLNAWERAFEPALALFDCLLVVEPDNVEARTDRARVLSWAGRFDASAADYAAVLARRPQQRAARMGLARVLSWSGRLDSARAVYASLLLDDPDDPEVQQGLARVTAWSGELRDAEAAWERSLELGGDETAARVGLSQTLRWQGRADSALAVLDGIPLDERSRPEYREERRWVDAALDAGLSPALTFEVDSDENEMFTAVMRGTHPVVPRIRVGLDMYARIATWDLGLTEARKSWGFAATARYLLEPGWTFTAQLGVSNANGTNAPIRPIVRAQASTPVREPIGGSLLLRHAPFDYTALLMENGVTFSEAAVTGRARPARRWNIDGGLSYALFRGSVSNRRLAAHVGGTRTITRQWAAAARLRTFGFQENVDDGYFDPDFYLLGEALVRWRPLRGPWLVTAEGGPGLEQITVKTIPPDSGTEASLRATVRLVARVGYEIGPGRSLGLEAVYTNAGLTSFAAGGAGYRYFAVTLAGGMSF
jgi:tetratricopeptide (TPR) repeat protein